jgi:hypothetical protein
LTATRDAPRATEEKCVAAGHTGQSERLRHQHWVAAPAPSRAAAGRRRAHVRTRPGPRPRARRRCCAGRRVLASPVDVIQRSARVMRPRADDARSVARQRGAIRGASEADGAGAAPVTRMGRLWPARTRKRLRKAPMVVRRARRPAPIRFAMPRRAPRVRALPAATRGDTTRGTGTVESGRQDLTYERR